ncbi:MAG: molybdenum cofactor biosynthesis protein MoaE [Verrucomicrobiales bacterium]|jgi:molybdopterin synthase catalytic subunit|nr:molybdenum cofactor biosynthesis protein MoaE [Verrucomicrobiales bacterium]
MASPHFLHTLSSTPVSEIEKAFFPSCQNGADLRFHGVVRDREEGRTISGIEYSHYEGMALSELGRICEAMEVQYPDHRAMIHHVTGFVAAGDASILIRVQTPHSAEAFEICREYLRRIKTTVPIWKKPIFEAEATAPEA